MWSPVWFGKSGPPCTRRIVTVGLALHVQIEHVKRAGLRAFTFMLEDVGAGGWGRETPDLNTIEQSLWFKAINANEQPPDYYGQ